MLGHSWFFWLGLVVPTGGGFVTFLVLRRISIQARRRETASLVVASWILAAFISARGGHFDLWSFLLLLPVVTAWAIGIDLGMADARANRDDRPR